MRRRRMIATFGGATLGWLDAQPVWALPGAWRLMFYPALLVLTVASYFLLWQFTRPDANGDTP